MPNIFQRIFRRKSSKTLTPEDLIGASARSKKSKLSRKQKRKLKKQESGSYPSSSQSSYKTGSSPANRYQAPHSLPDEVIRKPSFNTSTAPLSSDSGGHVSHSYSGSSSERQIKITHTSTGGNSSRNDSRSGGTSQSHSHEGDDSDSRSDSSGPVNDENHFVADFSGFTGDHNNRTNQTTSRLDYAHVQTFEKHMESVPIKPLYPQQSNKKRQLTRLPDGQLVAINHLANGVPSPMSASSEFDLSTDAEDNEYNQIRRTANNNLTPMLEQHSSTSSDDEDESVGLNTIIKTESGLIRRNASYLSNSESDTEEGPEAHVHDNGAYYVSDSDNEPDSAKTLPQGKNTEDLVNNQNPGSTTSPETEKDETHSFQFEQKFDETLAASQIKKKKAIDRDLLHSPSSGATTSSGGSEEKSLSTTLSPRTIAIQASRNMIKQGKLATELYPDSTDSELNDKTTQQQKDLLPPLSKSTDDSCSLDNGNMRRGNSDVVIENFADFGNSNFANLSELGSKSVANPTSPVSELLRQAKDRRNRRKEASSVNSAPVNNLGYNHKRDKGRKFKNGQSPARSRDDASASASSAAKEKLRRRRYEKEAYLKSLNNDSDEGSDKGGEANESWLFDEVTGALGPRGIAADLESLGERSGLSKASHRSHGKKRSRRSKRSDESIGSRHSRHSRSSRYSIKSTKSQQSVVSEQSRSVANDLLRLEMQLARVGSKTNDSKIEGSSMGDVCNGVKPSRKSSSRSKNAITKRVKLTVVAPAGKLGIILANKTDAKGTVVSGVRTTSALADRVSPGDRIIEIDGEDVSRMTVSEITSIMARKNDFERVLTVLTTSRDTEINSTAHLPTQGSDIGHDGQW